MSMEENVGSSCGGGKGLASSASDGDVRVFCCFGGVVARGVRSAIRARSASASRDL